MGAAFVVAHLLVMLVIGSGCTASETAPPGGIFGDRPREGTDGGEDARVEAGDAGSDARDAAPSDAAETGQ
jgi:hypothetical protein